MTCPLEDSEKSIILTAAENKFPKIKANFIDIGRNKNKGHKGFLNNKKMLFIPSLEENFASCSIAIALSKMQKISLDANLIKATKLLIFNTRYFFKFRHINVYPVKYFIKFICYFF